MEKLDLKKRYSFYKARQKEFSFVNIPILKYLMIDGKGNPNDNPDYKECLEILYGLVYKIKFNYKKKDKDFVVMPLEGLWYHDNMKLFSEKDKDSWRWTLMILVPDFINEEDLEQAKLQMNKKQLNTKIELVRLDFLTEGECIQILYVGPYNQETETISNMHKYINEKGYKKTGQHHEIYFNDPRKTDPSKLKTIIRQPVYKEKH